MRHNRLGILLFLLGLGLIGFSLTRSPAKPGLDPAPPASVPAPAADEPTAAPGSLPQPTAAVPTGLEQQADHPEQHAHAHEDLPDEILDQLSADRWDNRAHWFQGPQWAAEGRYLVTPVPVEPDHHCLQQGLVDPQQPLAQQIQQRYGQDLESQDASDTFFKSLTQFFHYQDRYWQIAAVWEHDMPPVYRLSLFSSPQADFEAEVRHELPPVPMPQPADALASQEWLDAVLAFFSSQGAETGARLVEQRIIDAAGQAHEWVSQNGQPLTWQFPAGVCALNRSGTSSRCWCQPAETVPVSETIPQ